MSNLVTISSPARTISPLHSAAAVEIAYQPIVSMTSFQTHGFEALARLPEASDYANILDLLDAAALDGTLRLVERSTLTKAITKFASFPDAAQVRLFCNIDNRVFDDPATSSDGLPQLIKLCGLEPSNICLELSERFAPQSVDALVEMIDRLHCHDIKVAIDDFGQGFSGLDTLMRISPHYIKIDRAFIDGIAQTTRQQAIVSKVIGLAHSLGCLVIAEGIETEADFRTTRDLGCDLAQGYLIARPDRALSSLRLNYGNVLTTEVRTTTVPRQIVELMIDLKPLSLGDPIAAAVARFKDGSAVNFLPVIDGFHHVHGAVYLDDLRSQMFGPYSAALMANTGIDQRLDSLVRSCPVGAANAPIDTLIDSYIAAPTGNGIVLTFADKYAGVLPNNAVLRLAAERAVANARDQNPLTFLPGNNSITRHLSDVLAAADDRTLVFFDFDNFKVFNDTYGFAVGDRALLMLSELLVKFQHANNAFIGHIGGDDFFASVPAAEAATVKAVRILTQKFAADVESLYLLDDRTRGGLWAKDRFGETRFLPLLRASCAILPLPHDRADVAAADIVTALAGGKSLAKKADDGVVVVCLAPPVAAPIVIQHRRSSPAGWMNGSSASETGDHRLTN